jgi:type IV pilus assembly protein PilC
MPAYTYVARDRNGNPQTGVIVTSDVNAVREQLRERDLYATSITAQKSGSDEGTRTRTSGRVKIQDMVVLSRQLATLVRAGMPINESLNTVAQQSENLFLRQVLQDVRKDILSGSSLTDAFQRRPKIFSELYCALVRAGEAGGVLEETLETAAVQIDKEAELREQIKSAATYPVIVVGATMAVVTFLIVFIIPVFAKVYESFHAKLPFVTQALIDVSMWIVNPIHLLISIAVLVVAVFVLRRYIATHRGRRHWDRFKLSVPLFGKLNRKICIARFTRTLASMVRAGVPLIQALAISARVSNNTIIMDAIQKVSDFVQQGARLWMPMEQSGEFPPLVCRMIAAGEESGNLDEMLSELTRFYERDVEFTVQKLTKIMEPLMTMMVGSVVLIVLIALYMPIFNLVNVIKQ